MTIRKIMTIKSQRTPDELAGIHWWNYLDEEGRRYWMQQAGNTGRAVDAWAAYKRASTNKCQHDGDRIVAKCDRPTWLVKGAGYAGKYIQFCQNCGSSWAWRY
ncbi:hypothetical protein V6S45_24255 (plasmid) [Escherichia coli]|uniref:hypothetical protein n=1 Tax=Escherichia coli TaxID=562 RepID=UPI001283E688|nr:hypothetical protein [Escherichia coli]EDH5432251.1 hypothetical protein [Salmonella enterica subsp. enterica serovar Duesseldorf]EDN4387479.1 DUF846 domain-containing protein [Salmonella enterica subsp. enterica serovar Duesseldorf]MDC8819367.1 hypothetical protein [Escherichia coli]